MAPKRKPEPEPEPQSEEDDVSEYEEIEEEVEEFEEVEEVEEVEEEESEEDSETSEEESEEEEEEEDDEDENENEAELKQETKIVENSENNFDPSDREAIRKLLEPFGKDQLIDLLKEAALRNPNLLSRLASVADADPIHRKIFVHGLSWDCTTEQLTSAFMPYGPIEECKAVMDRATGKCKGYGFIVFRNRAAAQKALNEPQKKIGNRITTCQLASLGPPGSQGNVPEGTGRKIFVSNVGEHVSPERLRSFFAKFGEIEEGPLGYDKLSGKLRGFALFVYKDVEGCKKALEEPKKLFDGCELNVQRAVEGMNKKLHGSAITGGVVSVQPSDLALAYGAQAYMGLNPMVGLMGQGLNPSVGLLGQNVGVGLLNQGAAATGYSVALSGGSATPPPPYGVGLGISGGGAGINSISPGVTGNYASQVALQGLGAYQTVANPSTPAKSQSGYGSKGTFFG